MAAQTPLEMLDDINVAENIVIEPTENMHSKECNTDYCLDELKQACSDVVQEVKISESDIDVAARAGLAKGNVKDHERIKPDPKAMKVLTGYFGFKMDDLSSMEGSEASDDSGIWMSVLKCYICGDLFRKPRILPCGHTFCSECLLSLRDEVAAEFKQKHKTACRRGESGVMACPYPDCDYSLRIMNLRRWALKNKAAAEAVGMIRKRSHDRRDITTQTNLQLGSQPLSFPRVLLTASRQQQEETTNSEDNMTNTILGMDPLSKSHMSLNTKVTSWRSWATLVGLNFVGELFSFR